MGTDLVTCRNGRVRTFHAWVCVFYVSSVCSSTDFHDSAPLTELFSTAQPSTSLTLSLNGRDCSLKCRPVFKYSNRTARRSLIPYPASLL
jgi:hypothetical protein